MAPGTRAATHTAARSAKRSGHSAWNRTSAAHALTAAVSRASMPSVVPTAAMGTTTRFATMPISESWLK